MNWDNYFMSIANIVALKSHCYSVKRGVIIVKDNTILSTGYNGPPSKISHCESRTGGILICPRKVMGYSSGEGLEYCPASHAEVNSIAHAARTGIGIKDATMYCAFEIPCRECAKIIINAGIKEIVVLELKVYDVKGISGKDLLEEAGIIVRQYVESPE